MCSLSDALVAAECIGIMEKFDLNVFNNIWVYYVIRYIMYLVSSVYLFIFIHKKGQAAGFKSSLYERSEASIVHHK